MNINGTLRKLNIKRIELVLPALFLLVMFSEGSSLYAQSHESNSSSLFSSEEVNIPHIKSNQINSSPVDKPFDHNIIFSISSGYQVYFDPLVELFGRHGFFVSGAVYGRVYDWIYVGGEISYSRSKNDIFLSGAVIELIPLEINVKYLLWIHENFAFDFGIGPTYTMMFFNSNNEPREILHLAGGQVIVGFAIKVEEFMIEQINKFTILMNYDNTDMNMSKFCTGIQLGVTF